MSKLQNSHYRTPSMNLLVAGRRHFGIHWSHFGNNWT